MSRYSNQNMKSNGKGFSIKLVVNFILLVIYITFV
jgi:hypothetical protein